MVDMGDESKIIPRNFSISSSTSENHSRKTSLAEMSDVNFNTSINSVVPLPVDDNDEIPLFPKKQINKNFLILSLSFVLLFTAHGCITALQSSLNVDGNVGINSLIVNYTLTLFSAIFLTGIIMDIFGLKWTIVLGEIGYILYIIANIRPLPSLMYISAAVNGICSAPLWTCQATYISRVARCYSSYKNEKVEVIVSLFFGIFFGIYATSDIWGNLVSYFILNESSAPQKFHCGIYFDPKSNYTSKQSDVVNNTTRYVLCGIFSGMGILSMLMLIIFLDQIPLSKSQSKKGLLRKSLQIFRSLFRWKDINQFLLIPLTMWVMIEGAFLVAQFTRAFITCLIGIRYIGVVLICNGICHAISCYIFGSLVKSIGRLGCFIIAALINCSMIILMYFWEPDDKQMYILFVISGLWGVASSVWQSQIVATYTILYMDDESSAIAKYRFWKSVGSLINYSVASIITIRLTLILLLGFLIFSMICYAIIEIRIRWNKNRK